MNYNWNYFIAGAVVVLGGLAVAFYRKAKGEVLSFDEYCENCIKVASEELRPSDEVAKAILVLVLTEDGAVAPFIYRRYKDGKVKKQRVRYRSCNLEMCPQEVQESIKKGEYIIKRF